MPTINKDKLDKVNKMSKKQDTAKFDEVRDNYIKLMKKFAKVEEELKQAKKAILAEVERLEIDPATPYEIHAKDGVIKVSKARETKVLDNSKAFTELSSVCGIEVTKELAKFAMADLKKHLPENIINGKLVRETRLGARSITVR